MSLNFSCCSPATSIPSPIAALNWMIDDVPALINTLEINDLAKKDHWKISVTIRPLRFLVKKAVIDSQKVHRRIFEIDNNLKTFFAAKFLVNEHVSISVHYLANINHTQRNINQNIIIYFSCPGILDARRWHICCIRSKSTAIRVTAIPGKATAAHARDSKELAVDLCDEIYEKCVIALFWIRLINASYWEFQQKKNDFIEKMLRRLD